MIPLIWTAGSIGLAVAIYQVFLFNWHLGVAACGMAIWTLSGAFIRVYKLGAFKEEDE